MNASRLNEGGGGGSYASTHPLSIQRMSDIENRVREIPVQAHQDSPSYWYVRSRLRLLQAGDVNSRQRTVQALQHDSTHAEGVQRSAAWDGLAWLAWQKKDYAASRPAPIGRASCRERVFPYV